MYMITYHGTQDQKIAYAREGKLGLWILIRWDYGYSQQIGI